MKRFWMTILLALLFMAEWTWGYYVGRRAGWNDALETVAHRIQTADLVVIQRIDHIARDVRALKRR